MINVGGGFNPQSLPPVRREWQNPGGGMVSSHGPGSGAPPTAPGMRMVTSDRNFLPLGGRVDSSTGGRGNLPPMGPGFGGGNTGITGGRYGGNGGGISMQNPMMNYGMGGGMGMGGGYGGMVQGPSFMQQPQQPQRNRMAGGVIDPSWRMKMAERAASTGTTPAEKIRLAGEGRADPMGWAARFQRQENPQPQQNMGMGGGDPMQFFSQMMPFWQMYSQMLGNRGQQGY
jgi:hypothetical protein